jgi:hypothetical protein
MGLFDAFRGGQAPGVYAPWMTYDPGAPQITPSQPVTPAGPLDTSPQSVTIPKGPSFWDRMNAADPNTGLSKWQQLGLVGASLRDDPSVFANQQNSMMEQGKLALSNQMTRQQMALASAFAHGMSGGRLAPRFRDQRPAGSPGPAIADRRHHGSASRGGRPSGHSRGGAADGHARNAPTGRWARSSLASTTRRCRSSMTTATTRSRRRAMS